MGQPNAKRAFHTAFATLGYTYVSYPNGPKMNTPAHPIPADTLWFVLHTLSSAPTARGLGDPTIRYKGLFQVTIKSPVTGANALPFGTNALDAAVDAIVARFKLGTSLPYGAVFAHCEEPQTTELGNVEPEWYTAIVRIPFWMDDAN
jgi:hypothetical protein